LDDQGGRAPGIDGDIKAGDDAGAMKRAVVEPLLVGDVPLLGLEVVDPEDLTGEVVVADRRPAIAAVLLGSPVAHRAT
jgi:hypothetical protein